ncbi:MAG: rhodanese-like domain-containing protein [Pseudomonadota bacterium]
MRHILALVFMSFSAVSAGAFGPLTEPDADLAGIQILDIRGAEDFAAGHIPGAANTPYGLYRGPKDNPGRVPDLAALEAVLSTAGLVQDQPVLVVHQGKNATDFGSAARVYWTLKSAGFASLSILNGGFDAWAPGNTPVTGASTPEPSNITLSWSGKWMIDAEGVESVVAGESEAVLLDARPEAFFKGEQKHGAAREAGTLAGALNIVHSTWFQSGTPRVDAPDDMITQIQTIAADANAPLVSFCNTGHWAATNWFAASELAGVEGVKLYPESMVGWTGLGNAVVRGGN